MLTAIKPRRRSEKDLKMDFIAAKFLKMDFIGEIQGRNESILNMAITHNSKIFGPKVNTHQARWTIDSEITPLQNPSFLHAVFLRLTCDFLFTSSSSQAPRAA
jgi:hypothetical protein